jgi:replicative DNA helicase
MSDQYDFEPDNDTLDLRLADQQSEAEPLRPERLAPHSADAEEAILGSILINGEVISEISAFLRAEDFFILKHGLIWDVMLAIFERGEHIDDLTVIDELQARHQLDEIGGPAFITRLITHTPTYIHAETYGHLVERAATRRRLIAAASEIVRAAQDEKSDIKEVVNHAELTLFAVTERNLGRDLLPMRNAISNYYRAVEAQYEHRGEPLGLPTGFNDLNALLGGLQRSDLIIVAARPGVGKTSFLLSLALNAARLANARVAIFSMEMSNEQLVQRLVSAETGINSQKLRGGNLDDSEWTLFTQSVINLGNLSIYLDDTPGISPLEMRTKCRRLYREHGLDLIIVDYLQLMNSGQSHNDNRVQEIGYISRNLKELARELNVPLISAAQLSRQVEQRADKHPMLSDLRESGSIEQDADIVMFIYRDELYNEATEHPNQAEIIIAKHRNGPTGIVTLHFNKALTKFGNLKHDTYNLGNS